MDDKTQEKNKPKKSYIGVFDPKEHQEMFERKMDKAYSEVHELQVQRVKRERRQEDVQKRAHAKAMNTSIRRAEVISNIF